MERLFREFQCCEYKRTGMGTLGRTARAMVAETPMMKNLDCPEFMNIILDGQPTLAARVAQLDIRSVQYCGNRCWYVWLCSSQIFN